MKPIHPNEPLAGCTVVRWSENGPEAVLRCPCGQTFPVPKVQAAAAGATLWCPECTPAPSVESTRPQNQKGLYRGLSRPQYRTSRSREAEALMLAGGHPWDVAVKLGMRGQSADRIFDKWVRPQLAARRIAELEARVAELEGR